MRYLKKNSYHLEEADSEGTWALSYGDMITLLLSFFVIFFTTDIKKEKVNKLNDFLSFSIQEIDEEKKTTSINMQEFKDLDIKVHKVNERVVVTFGRFSFFNSGESTLRDEGVEVLKKFAEKFLPFAGNYHISIKGFTDKRPISSQNVKFRDNLELSAIRSISSMRVLQTSGIPLDRMEIAGAGEMKDLQKIIPTDANMGQDKVLELSRTVVIVITPEKESWL